MGYWFVDVVVLVKIICSIFIFGFLINGCGSSKPPRVDSGIIPTSSTPITQREPESNSPSDRGIAARTVIFTDTNERVGEDDLRVKRVMYLLENISRKTKSTDQEICAKTLAAVGVLKDKYGVSLSMQAFLEEAKKLLDFNTLRPKKQQSLLGDFDSVALVVMTVHAK